MTENKNAQNRAGELRRQAEKMSRKEAPDIPEDLEGLSLAAVRKLLHELRVHQIELEMQNEDLRAAQEKLEEAHAQYFELYDVAPVGYFSISEKGLILEANLTGANLLQMVPLDLRAQRFTHFIYKDDQDVYYLHRKELFETRAPQLCEMRMVRGDGALIWVRMEATLAQDGKSGKPVCRAAISGITERKRAEDELRESEARYQRITEGLTDYLYTVRLRDGQAVETVHSQACAAVTGYSEEEFADNPNLWISMVAAEDRGLVSERVQRILAGENIAPIEHRIVRKDGQIRWVSDTPILQFDPRGRLLSYDGVVKDITSRKQAEEALRKSEELYRSLIECSSDAIFCVDEKGQYKFTNHLFASTFGKSPDYFIGKTFWDIYPKEHADYRFEATKRVFQTGQSESLEVEVPLPDRTLFFYATANPIKDETGKVVLSLTHAVDITGRKQAEAALHASEEKYRMVVEHAREAILIIVDGILKFANRETQEITGYSQEELVSRPFTDFIHLDDRQMVAERYLQRLKGVDMSNRNTFRVIPRAGNIKWVEVTATVINWEDKPASLYFVTDITDRKRLEEEQQKVAKLESIGVLAGGIAHDFNNILTAILGNISLAGMEAAPGSEIRKSLEQAEKASLRATALTKQLLTFARGGAPVTKLASLTVLLEDTAGFALRGSNVKCHFSIPAGLWHVEIDAGQVSQVIHNLVINAQQAMPSGGSIELSAENITSSRMQDLGRGLPLKEGDYVRIAVADHGAGITAEHLDKVFDPFFTTKQKGSGLGLATSFSVARQHGGHLSVESELGAGSTFYLYLPASMRTVATKQDKQDEKERVKAAGKARILVMDDEKAVREIAGRMLKHLGYRDIEFAEDGAEAIKLYKAAMKSGHPFTVAILDLTIAGGMGGELAIQKLLKIDPAVKAIVSSGYADDPVIAKCSDYGFSGMITKPYTIEELGKALQEVIG